MFLENLESRNLLAGDGDPSKDVDFAEAGLAIAKDAAIGAVHGYLFPATLRVVAEGALGAAGGLVVVGATVVAVEGISSVVQTFSSGSNDDTFSSGEDVFMEGTEGWGISAQGLDVIIETGMAGAVIGAAGALLNVAEAGSWSPFVSETQDRVLAGAAGGAVMGAILHLWG